MWASPDAFFKAQFLNCQFSSLLFIVISARVVQSDLPLLYSRSVHTGKINYVSSLFAPIIF
jgi:hypothetical protein